MAWGIASSHRCTRPSSSRLRRPASHHNGWSGRIAPPNGEVSPIGPIEAFLVAVLEQLRARAEASELGMECAARPALDLVRETAAKAARLGLEPRAFLEHFDSGTFFETTGDSILTGPTEANVSDLMLLLT